MIKIEIKNRFTGKILFEYSKENNTVKETLVEAVSKGVDLKGADLKGAYLKWAYLEGANLEGANLSSIKNDFWEILLKTKNEIPGLKKALINGKIDGSCYEGECCCLVGTIAKLKQCEYRTLEGVAPNASRPAESWFTNIDPGDTPENSQVVKITLEWIEEFELYLNK